MHPPLLHRAAKPDGRALERYAGFFALFDDFRGFVDHFFLQDLTTADHSEVVFFMPFDDFKPPAMPRDVPTYLEYRRRTIDFIAARNSRIDKAVNCGKAKHADGRLRAEKRPT